MEIVHPDSEFWPSELTDNGASELFIIELKETIIGKDLTDVVYANYEKTKRNLNLLLDMNESIKRFNNMMEGDGYLVFEEILDDDEIEELHDDIHDAFDEGTAILFSLRGEKPYDGEEEDDEGNDEDEEEDDEDEEDY